MDEVPITNTGDCVRYVAGVAIPPGETRLVSRALIPAPEQESKDGALDNASSDPLHGLLEHSVKDIVGTFDDLDVEDLRRLEAAEREGASRVTLLQALSEEILKRANREADGCSNA